MVDADAVVVWAILAKVLERNWALHAVGAEQVAALGLLAQACPRSLAISLVVDVEQESLRESNYLQVFRKSLVFFLAADAGATSVLPVQLCL